MNNSINEISKTSSDTTMVKLKILSGHALKCEHVEAKQSQTNMKASSTTLSFLTALTKTI